MKTKSENFISCLASHYKQPIADLIDRLVKVELPDSPDSPRAPEVDYAISLIVLLVLVFEAWMSRARHFDSAPAQDIKAKQSVLPWMKSLKDGRLQPTIESLQEVYFLRDAIVHNHVWVYTQTWLDGKAYYSNFNLDRSWQGNSHFKRDVKGEMPFSALPRTKRLNLVVVPSFVSRREVATVFKTIKDALKTLDEFGLVTNIPKIPYVRFGGKLSFPFWNLIPVIQKSFLVTPNRCNSRKALCSR